MARDREDRGVVLMPDPYKRSQPGKALKALFGRGSKRKAAAAAAPKARAAPKPKPVAKAKAAPKPAPKRASRAAPKAAKSSPKGRSPAATSRRESPHPDVSKARKKTQKITHPRARVSKKHEEDRLAAKKADPPSSYAARVKAREKRDDAAKGSPSKGAKGTVPKKTRIAYPEGGETSKSKQASKPGTHPRARISQKSETERRTRKKAEPPTSSYAARVKSREAGKKATPKTIRASEKPLKRAPSDAELSADRKAAAKRRENWLKQKAAEKKRAKPKPKPKPKPEAKAAPKDRAHSRAGVDRAFEKAEAAAKPIRKLKTTDPSKRTAKPKPKPKKAAPKKRVHSRAGVDRALWLTEQGSPGVGRLNTAEREALSEARRKRRAEEKKTTTKPKANTIFKQGSIPTAPSKRHKTDYEIRKLDNEDYTFYTGQDNKMYQVKKK